MKKKSHILLCVASLAAVCVFWHKQPWAFSKSCCLWQDKPCIFVMVVAMWLLIAVREHCELFYPLNFRRVELNQKHKFKDARAQHLKALGIQLTSDAYFWHFWPWISTWCYISEVSIVMEATASTVKTYFISRNWSSFSFQVLLFAMLQKIYSKCFSITMSICLL